MNFNSLEFLIFLPIVVAVYWILPHKIRWAWLLAASYYFYMSWNAWLVFLILGTTVVSYVSGIVIDRTKSKALKKTFLIITLVVCLGTLVFFKYFNFLMQSAIDFLNLFSMHLDSVTLDIILPIGISFYTFQTLSYVIDVYRGTVKPEKHFGYYALFVSYFPQLVAGPIERPGDLIPQLRAEHTIDADDMNAGLRIMLMGFFRKCVIADFCGVYVTNVFSDLAAANSLAIFIAGALFFVQIYCDFAGYSEIATGAARMMGVKLTRNFDRPFLSVSMSEFFRRWHISLGKWFADYVYIPLGGNRKGMARKILNTFIVFGLCGLWHGASWTYVLWGLYVAVFIALENLLRKPCLALCKKANIDLNNNAVKLVRATLLFLVFIPAALMFRASSLQQGWQAITGMFTSFGGGSAYFDNALTALGMNTVDILRLAMSIVCMIMIYYFGEYGRKTALPLYSPTSPKTTARTLYAQRSITFMYAILAIAVCWIALVSKGDVSNFAYFQF